MDICLVRDIDLTFLVRDYKCNVLKITVLLVFLVLTSNLSAYMMLPVIEKSFDYFFNTCFISLDPNMYYISLTLCTKYRIKTRNNINEFTQSNWITLSYYSSPKHKSLLPRYLIHFYNFCIESFSPI